MQGFTSALVGASLVVFGTSACGGSDSNGGNSGSSGAGVDLGSGGSSQAGRAGATGGAGGSSAGQTAAGQAGGTTTTAGGGGQAGASGGESGGSGGSSGGAGGGPLPPELTWVREGPSRVLEDIWGSGPEDIYAVGRNGNLVHSKGDAAKRCGTAPHSCLNVRT